MFEYEIGNVRIIIESQSGWRPNEDMKMSHPDEDMKMSHPVRLG